MIFFLLGIGGYFVVGIIIGLIVVRISMGRLTEANEREWLNTFWVCVFLWPLLLLLGAGNLLKELVEHLAKKAGGLKIGPQDRFRSDAS